MLQLMNYLIKNLSSINIKLIPSALLVWNALCHIIYILMLVKNHLENGSKANEKDRSEVCHRNTFLSLFLSSAEDCGAFQQQQQD